MMPIKIFQILYFLLTINTIVFCEDESVTIHKINNNLKYILHASDKFNISPNILASIIFTERTLNFDISDEVFDRPLAESGYNSSLGFCQIKIKTAYFIEKQLSDTMSEFSPGRRYKGLLPISKNPDELINKLSIDSINIMYAAAYLRIIQSRWANKGFPIDSRPEIIGSIYQLGMFDDNGKERKPHWNPVASEFGKRVIEATYLFN